MQVCPTVKPRYFVYHGVEPKIPAHWDRYIVSHWLAEAADTLQRMHDSDARFRRAITSNLPHLMRHGCQALDADQAPSKRAADRRGPLRFGPASPGAIDRFWQVVNWLQALPDLRMRKILWLRAAHIPGARIARLLQCSRKTVQRQIQAGLQQITGLLNQAETQPVLVPADQNKRPRAR